MGGIAGGPEGLYPVATDYRRRETLGWNSRGHSCSEELATVASNSLELSASNCTTIHTSRLL